MRPALPVSVGITKIGIIGSTVVATGYSQGLSSLLMVKMLTSVLLCSFFLSHY